MTRPNLGLLGGGGNFVNGGGGQNNTEATRFRQSGGSVLVVNGARATNNNFTLDGVDNNESQFGQIAIYPNPDAIRNSRLNRACLLLNPGGQVEESFRSRSSQVAMRCMEQLVRFIKDASGVLRQASLTIQRRCRCRTT